MAKKQQQKTKRRQNGGNNNVYVMVKTENKKINETTTIPPLDEKITIIGKIVKTNEKPKPYFKKEYTPLKNVESISLSSNDYSAFIEEINDKMFEDYTAEDLFFFTVKRKLIPLKPTSENRTTQKNNTRSKRNSTLHTIPERNSNSQ